MKSYNLRNNFTAYGLKRKARRLRGKLPLALLAAALISLAWAGQGSLAAGSMPRALSTGYQTVARRQADFGFILASDSHLGDSRGNANTRLALRHMKEQFEDAAFMIHMGDITETGSSSQYHLYADEISLLPFPVFATLGNHESKWQDPHGANFRTRFGSPAYSFDYGLWHFVVLDTTYPGETLGTLGPETIAWLERDLGAIADNRPVAIFSHHPLCYQPREFQDSDHLVIDLLDKYNIRAVFGGHGHCFIPWKVQGCDFFMAGALLDAAYALVEVSGVEMRVYSVDAAEQPSEPVLVGSVTGKPAANPIKELSVALRNGVLEGEYTLDTPGNAEVQVDTDGYLDLGHRSEGRHQFSLDVSKHAEGTHTLTLRAKTSDGPYYSISTFHKDGSHILWEANLEGTAVGNMLAVDPGKVVVGTRDGSITCLNVQDGTVVWTYNAGSPWGGGTLDGHRIIFGTHSGHITCIDSRDGSLIWRTAVDPAGFCAAPAVYPGRLGKSIYVGSPSGKVYSLNAFLGVKQWEFQARGAVVCTPAQGQDKIFFGAWDNNLYALDQTDGTLVWEAALGRQIYYSPWADPVYFANKVLTVTPYDTQSGGSHLWALDPAAGNAVWRYTARGTLQSPAAAPNGGPFKGSGPSVAIGTYGGGLTLISPWTGAVLRYSEGSATHFISPAINEDVWVTGGYRGLLKITTQDTAFDVKVTNSYILMKPLLTKGFSEERGRMLPVIVVADTQGSVWAISAHD